MGYSSLSLTNSSRYVRGKARISSIEMQLLTKAALIIFVMEMIQPIQYGAVAKMARTNSHRKEYYELFNEL